MLHPAALAYALVLAEPSITLDWQAPHECPDAASVRVMTLDLLRRQASDGSTPPVDVRVIVTRDGDRWRATIALRSSLGRVDRPLTATGCPLLARATALLVAVHLDPIAVSRTIGPLLGPPVPPTLPPEPPTSLPSNDLSSATATDPPPNLSSATATEPPPGLSSGTAASETPQAFPTPVWPLADDLPVRDPSASPGPAPMPLHGHLRLAGGFDGGLLPGNGGDLELAGGVGGRRWRVEAGLLGVPRRIQPASETAPGARFNRLAGVARACAVWRIPPQREQVALLGCLGGEAGGVHAVATGVAVQQPRWIPWGAALFGGAARIPLIGPLGLWIGVEAVIALRRSAFTVGEVPSTVFTIPRAGVRANLGFDLQFIARKRRPPTTD